MSNETIDETVERIKSASDRKAKAEIAGLIREPLTQDDLAMACDNCIYFLPRKRWCDLPELDFPVDPDWYCKLWRV